MKFDSEGRTDAVRAVMMVVVMTAEQRAGAVTGSAYEPKRTRAMSFRGTQSWCILCVCWLSVCCVLSFVVGTEVADPAANWPCVLCSVAVVLSCV